jgi:hypothetical protein
MFIYIFRITREAALLWIKMYKYHIYALVRALICRALRDRVADGGLIRLAYRTDQSPHG